MPASPISRAVAMARSANGMDRAGLSREHQVRGKARQHARLLGRRRRAVQQIHGFLEPLDRRRRVAGQPRGEPELLAGARPSLRVGACVGRGVDQLDRLAGEADRSGRVADHDRRRCGRVEDIGEVAVGGSVLGRHHVPQLGRALVLARGLGIGIDGLGRVGGAERGMQRQGRFLRCRPVVGELAPAGWPAPRRLRPAAPRSRGRRRRGAPVARTAGAGRTPLPARARAGRHSARPRPPR